MQNNWPTKKLGELCEIYQPQTITSNEILKEGLFKVFGANGVIGYYSKFNHEDPEVIIGCRGTCGSVYFTEPQSWITGNAMVVRPKAKDLLKDYLYYLLKITNLKKAITGTSQPQITRGTLSPIKISVPPIKIQRKIVERLDAIKKAQELNDKQIELAEELFQSLLHRELDPKGKNWEIKKMGEIANFQYGYTESAKENGNFRFVRITDINDNGELIDLDKKYIQVDERDVTPYILEENDLLIARTGATFGKMLYFNSVEPSVFVSYLIRVISNRDIIIPKFIWLFSQTPDYWRQARSLMTGSGQQQFNANKIKRIKISLPPIEIQKRIVEKLSAVQEYKKKLLEQKRKLQELFESVLNKSFQIFKTKTKKGKIFLVG